MGRSQREKGKRGEREAKDALNKLFGLSSIRAAQSNGKYSEDILGGLSGFHTEVKRYKRHSVLAWVRKTAEDSGAAAPLVMLREDGDPEWYVVLRLSDSYRYAEAVIATPAARLVPADDAPSGSLPRTSP